MSETSTELVVLPDGQLIDISDPAQCARAIEDIRDLESRLREAKGAIVESVQAYASLNATGKTITLEDGTKMVLQGGEEVLWDANQLEADFREAGMPEARIREIIVEEVSYKVKANEAKKAASVNPVYAAAVERARTVLQTRPTIAIKA